MNVMNYKGYAARIEYSDEVMATGRRRHPSGTVSDATAYAAVRHLS
jgi:predicted HicB family RNase H-like nuclease